jgi:serine protease Do
MVKVLDAYDPIFQRFYGHQKEEQNSIGSGVIIDEDGYFLTNLHVLERATRVQVKLSDGSIYDVERGKTIADMDLALLRIKAPDGTKFHAVKLAKDDDLLLGESVIAVGNPFGLGGTVTRGILSSKERRLNSGGKVQDLLQTDADINPGNSGGPLVNLRGELIGINVAVGEGQGIGFAIPVKQIASALAEFYTPESARGLWFGARAGSFNAPLTVTFVQPRSPAEQAGLRVGQRIVNVNNQTPRNLVEFQRLVTARSDNQVMIEVEDHGRRRSCPVQLISFNDLFRQKLGVLLDNITPRTTTRANGSPGEGVIIEDIEKDSPADKAKLLPGFVITAIDEEKISEVLKAADVLSTKTAGVRAVISFVVPAQFGERSGRYNTTVTLR